MRIRALKPTLVRIDNLIRRYHQVFDMSRLNVLTELRQAIADWAADKIDRDSNSKRWPAMEALEDITLRKLHELDNFGKHRYTRAMCIAFELKTGDYQSAPPKHDVERFNKENEDIDSRTDQLRQAIIQAYNQVRLATTSVSPAEQRKTLKIFMAPEFFFRGPYGAYADIGMIHAIFKKMSLTTKDPKFSDWIFVHGTAIFTSDKMKKDVKQGNLLENYALVQRGGPSGGQHLDEFVIAKEFPSHIDFKLTNIPNANWNWYKSSKPQAVIGGKAVTAIKPEGGRVDPITKSLPETKQKHLSELTGGTIFTMHGIRFGLEVCRDHHQGRLAHSLESGSLSIQLIPSAGMGITQTSIACRPGGLVFNVDGITPHTEIEVTGNNPQPVLRKSVAVAGGLLKVFTSSVISYPGDLRADVAKRLNQLPAILNGAAPVLPPR